jgi:spore photoproduct lyase
MTETDAAAPAVPDPSSRIRSLFIENGVQREPLTAAILERLGDLPVQVIPERSSPPLEASSTPESLQHGKRVLFLTRNRGKFLKPCPATREYRCCDYQVLNIGMNCPMDCVYCILQAYLNNPWLSFFVNIDEMFAEIDRALKDNGKVFSRIGTGEFSDSMALDRLTGLSTSLIKFFSNKQNAVLELKSKAVVLDHLQDVDHCGRTVMAWSLNSPAVMAREELHTASLDQRLAAAAQCAAWGYKLAFHFDPLIYHPGWEEGYAETVRKLFAVVPAENIVWISLGALRFLPQLKAIATSRFPGSRFFHEEFIIGLDNKYRYFRTLRVSMYRRIVRQILDSAHAATRVYLCMESDEIWQEVFGYRPADFGGLPAMLDAAAQRAVQGGIFQPRFNRK